MNESGKFQQAPGCSFVIYEDNEAYYIDDDDIELIFFFPRVLIFPVFQLKIDK